MDKQIIINLKRPAAVLFALLLALRLLAGCASPASPPPAAEEPAAVPAAPEETPEALPLLDLTSGSALPAQAIWTEPGQFSIVAAGTYRLTGSLDGRITVDADGPVTLVLEGVTLVGESCLDIRSRDPVTLVGAAGAENVFTDTLPASASGEASSSEPAPDGASASDADPVSGEDASGAVITSKAPLLFAAGSVTVTAYVNNGVRAKDGLTVAGGAVEVTAANNGLKVTGELSVTDGALTVRSGGDGLAAEASRLSTGGVRITGGKTVIDASDRGIDAEGFASLSGGELILTAADDGIRADRVTIDAGTLTIDAGCDGIQAGSLLSVSGGRLAITTGGGGGDAISHPGESFGPWARTAAEEDAASAKGLKSDGDIAVSGGVIDLSTADDAIHCAAICTIDGGEITIVSSDDAIHADDMLVINDGTVRIDDSFEGLEAFAVELHGGDVVIRAVNDGINANGPEGWGWRGTETTEITSASGSTVTYVLISGGTLDLAVTGNTGNMGDGIDSNGAVYITGGEVIVSTYGTFMENGIDTGWGGPVVTGGKVIAGGSSTMAEGFSSDSTQCSAVIATSYMPDGTRVVLSDAEGNVLWDVTLRDAFSCLQLSHPALTVGQVYTLAYGDQTTVLDFTNTNRIENSWGFGGPGGGFRPF